MGLLDTIRTNLAATANPTAVGGISDNTAQVAALSQAKTGKVGGVATAPKSSNLQEQVAAGQAALGAAELQQQAKAKSQELAQVEKSQTEQQGLQERQLDEAQLQQHDTFANQSARIMADLSQQNRTLDFKKDAAKVEQLGINARLANDKYTTQLEQEGARSRLDTEIGFDEALQNAIWDDEKELLDHDMDFKVAINGKANDFNEYMSNLELETAVAIADANTKSANQNMIWGAVGSATSAGVGMAASKGVFDSKPAAGSSTSGWSKPGEAQVEDRQAISSSRGAGRFEQGRR